MKSARCLSARLATGAFSLMITAACAVGEPVRGGGWSDSASDAGTVTQDAAAAFDDARTPEVLEDGADAASPDRADASEMLGEEADAGVEAVDGSWPEMPDSGSAQEAFAFCERYSAAPIQTAMLQDARLTGVSGIVASRRNAGILWVHNDFPGVPAVYAVEAATGITRGILRAPASFLALNLEDIALARCPAPVDGKAEAAVETCLWLADSGNNEKRRTDLSIIALPEPLLSWPGRGTAEGAALAEEWVATDAWRFPVAYPGDNLDSEAFVVEPDGSAFYLIEKVDGQEARLFEARGPFVDGEQVILAQIGALPAREFIITPTLGRMMTGADLHPSRQRFVLRSYIGSFEYRFATDDWPAELPSVTPVTVAWGPLSEPQGEAIAYDACGASLWTISEDPNQQPGQGIHFYPCLDASADAATAAPAE